MVEMVGAQFKARELCMLRGAGLRSCVLDLGQGSKINSTPLKGCGTKEKQERLAKRSRNTWQIATIYMSLPQSFFKSIFNLYS